MLIPLLALTAVAILLGLALRRVRDGALAALGVIGFFLVAVPAMFINGDLMERIIAAILAYSPYWQYAIPITAFALALLPPPKREKNRIKTTKQIKKVEYW